MLQKYKKISISRIWILIKIMIIPYPDRIIVRIMFKQCLNTLKFRNYKVNNFWRIPTNNLEIISIKTKTRENHQIMIFLNSNKIIDIISMKDLYQYKILISQT